MSFLSSSYMSSFVGFDSLFEEIERMSSSKQSSYPAYDIKKLSDNEFVIVLALAGFSQDDLSVETKSGELTVSGNSERNLQTEFIHKGIENRAFKRLFRLADYIEVDGAEFKDGLLSIFLHREIPEKELPRKIVINKNLYKWLKKNIVLILSMDKNNSKHQRNDLLKKVINKENKSLKEKIQTLKLSREIDKEKFETAIRTILKK